MSSCPQHESQHAEFKYIIRCAVLISDKIYLLILVCPVVLIVRPPSLNEPLGMKPYLELTNPEYRKNSKIWDT